MDHKALSQWFDNTRRVLETAYLSHEEPWRQSGMSGPADRWCSLRKPVADCIDRSGSFLDIGCASGYLLECCVKWTSERGSTLDPFGLDISEKLIALARKKLPQWADRFQVGNAYEWQPPKRFDFVRTELVYVPSEQERQYVLHLLANYLNPGGKLMVANYAEDMPNPEQGLMPGNHPTRKLLDRLAELGFAPVGFKDGYDPVKERRVRVAMLVADRPG